MVQGFFKEHMVTLIGWLVGLGVVLGGLSAIKTDVADLKQEQATFQQVKWQGEANAKAIEKKDADDKQRDKEIADIKAKIDVINTKLDMILEAVKKQGK